MVQAARSTEGGAGTAPAASPDVKTAAGITIDIPPGTATSSTATSPNAAAADASKATPKGGKGRKPREKRDVVPYKALYRMADGWDKLCYAIATVAACANGCIFPLFTLIFAALLDSFNSPTSGGIAETASKYALYFLLIALGAGLCTAAEIALPMLAAERQMRRVRQAYLKALLRQDMGFFDTNRVGEVASRMAEDTVTMSAGIGDKVTNTIHYSITFVAGIIVGFTKSWQLTLIIFTIIPMIAIIMGFLKKGTESFEARVAAAYARAGDTANEVFSQIRTVAAYGGEEAEVQRYDDHLMVSQVNGGKKGWLIGAAVGSLFGLLFAIYGIGALVGARLIITSRTDHPACRFDPTGDGCFSGGTVVSTFMAVIIGAFSLGQAAPNFASFGSAQAAAYKIYQVIDRVPVIDTEATGGAKPPAETLQGRIEFRDVTFAYPSRPTETILSHFNLVIEPGTTLALVGESGSGKSTLMQLLQRFYDPQEGSVLVDGIDVKEWNVTYLRDHIGIVSQEPTLFGTSVANNISYGKGGATPATQAEIEAAAASANAHEFISGLPEGYNTVVGTSVSTTQLSGGQRQRICIARAIIRDPTYLLLDEATSALDTNSERVVQAALDKLMSTSAHKRTTLVIAHRLSTITGADRIVVMERGRLAESGTHAELMALAGGIYARLRTMQDLHTQKTALNITVPGVSAAAGQVIASPTAAGAVATPTAAPVSPTAAPVSPTAAAATPKAGAAGGDKKASEEEEDVGEPEAAPVSRMRVWRMQAPEWAFIVVGLVGSIASGVIQPLFGIIWSDMIGQFFNPDDEALKSTSNTYVGYFIAIALGHMCATILRIGCFVYLGEVLTRRLRVQVFRAVLRNEMAFFDDKRNSVGRLNTRLANDAAEVKGGTGEALSMTIQAAAAIIAGMVIAFVASWRLALVVMAIVPLMIISALFQGKAFKGFNVGAAKALEESGHIATESMAAIRTVAAFNLQGRMLDVFDQSLAKPMKAGVGRALSAGTGQMFSQFVLFAGYSLAFYAGGQFIANGDLDFSALMRVFLALTMASQAAGNALNWGPDKSKADRATRNIFGLIDRVSAIDPLSAAGAKPEAPLTGHITFRNVSFSYPSRPDRVVLSGVNLDIAPGQKVALVGPSGSGKSTVVQLLERFYNPTSGDICVDGVPIGDLNVAWLRSQMGLVQQEPALMGDSIAYNIEYGRVGTKPPHDAGVALDAPADAVVASESVVPADVIEAANAANATEFVDKFKHKFATHVGARGSQLSGGQKQRIAIARALVRHPQLLLCDEATSALDSQSESVVQAALDRVLAGTDGHKRTSVVIAHRLATIRDADLIVVIDKGHVVEQGTHEQLIELEGGLYRSLALAQDSGSSPTASAAAAPAPASAQ